MSTPLPPGSVVGILGGGQLGRMMAQAAAELGFKTHVFSNKRGSATQVTSRRTIAEYTDAEALTEWAKAVDVATLEWENVPAESVRLVSEHAPVRPGARALSICQDRIAEKTFLSEEVGVPTAMWAPVRSPSDLHHALAELDRPCVLKTARFGYDGKGQTRVTPGEDAAAAWARIGGDKADITAILEAFVPFEIEGSIVLARALDGSVAAFDLVHNEHRAHVLHRTHAPAQVAEAVRTEAGRIARRIVDALDYVGVLGVELFLLPDGQVLVNELAPRPHNSGHWTMDGAITSQFEQAIRAVTGHGLGSPRRLADAVMTNLIGDDVERTAEILSDPDARLHLYGKTDIRSGRKMGHVTHLSLLSRLTD